MSSDSGKAARFRAGDPLRALAAVAVLATHAFAVVVLMAQGRGPAVAQASVVGPALSHVANGLSAGVYVFFVLSGYLVGGPFIRAFIDGSPPSGTFDYLRNRAVRILPLFWAAAALTLLVFGHRPVFGMQHHRDFSAFDVAAIFGFFQQLHFSPAAITFGQAWTLHVEVLFYLALPALALAGAVVAPRLQRRTRIALAAAVLIAIWIASAAVRAHSQEWTGWRGESSFVCSAWAFVPGVALALLEATRVPAVFGMGRLRRLATLLALLGLGTYVFVVVRADSPPAGQISMSTTVLLSIAFFALVAAPLARQRGGAAGWRVLDNGPLQWLGRRSYGIYLLHVLVLILVADVVSHVTGSVALRVFLLFGLGLLLTAALADLGWRLIERPFLGLRSRPYGLTAGTAHDSESLTGESAHPEPLAPPSLAARSAAGI